MYDIYNWPTSNGRKINIAVEELEVEYKIHPIAIGKGDQFSAEFTELNPNQKIPAVIDQDGPDGQPYTMFESGAILMYLAEKHGKLIPTDMTKRYEVIQWLMFQMGGVGPMLGQAHHFLKYNQGKAPYAEKRYRDEANRLYSVLDRRLESREFLSGSYSIADMATWPWISRYEWQEIDFGLYPNLKRWYLEIASRPAVQRGYQVPMFVNEIPIPD